MVDAPLLKVKNIMHFKKRRGVLPTTTIPYVNHHLAVLLEDQKRTKTVGFAGPGEESGG